MDNLSKNGIKLSEFLSEKTQKGELTNDYAKQFNMSYNGVKKTREIVNLFGVKLVIDNK